MWMLLGTYGIPFRLRMSVFSPFPNLCRQGTYENGALQHNPGVISVRQRSECHCSNHPFHSRITCKQSTCNAQCAKIIS